MKTIQGQNCIIKSYCENPESGAIDQARNIAKLPNIFHHVVLLPDTHPGFGMPIGCVAALTDSISPYMVGEDIGCGMCAVKTSLTEIDTDILKKIMSKIREAIPLGRDHQAKAQDKALLPWFDFDKGKKTEGTMMPVVCKEYDFARYQIGTLGGGNHFIEIQKGDDGHIWIMIHSGSRNIGSKVAFYYHNIAVALNKKYHTAVEDSWQLNFLPLDSQEGKQYLTEMNYCIEFALANRKVMMDRILTIFANECSVHSEYGDTYFDFEPMINIAHNYASIENHFGKNVWVHRKGATLAREKTIGIIPGSQGSKSYIIKGKGNPESFMSCSHGAGRAISRRYAREQLNLQDEIDKLNSKGIIHSVRQQTDLDEAPGAYKNIDIVMEEQTELVDIIVKLEPLAVIKG